MAIPNLLPDVEAARQKYPTAWANAHTGNTQTEDFIRLLARDVRATHGSRWGLNGKRGKPQDISDDVLAYAGEGSAVDVVNGGPMEIIDVIAGAGGPSPQPVWNVGPGGPGDKGTVVTSFTVPGDPTPGPVPPPVKPCPDPSAHLPKPPKPYPGDGKGAELGTAIFADYAAVAQPANPGMMIWAWRTAWDAANEGLTMDQSITKHRNEWRAILGLPPL